MFDLRVGERSEALDALLRHAGLRWWAFVTAWNPGSRALPGWRNRGRQRLLCRRLASGMSAWGRARAPLVLPAAGIPRGEDWGAEGSLLVAGLPPSAALRLARAFGQNAIIAGHRGRAARLVWVRRSGFTA